MQKTCLTLLNKTLTIHIVGVGFGGDERVADKVTLG